MGGGGGGGGGDVRSLTCTLISGLDAFSSQSYYANFALSARRHQQ